ncbi:Odorant receptor 83b [Apis cerana cerana]|uniref:Odorant receptor n=1 Tax=Apis cerana cerana TaxID=94128 RepID=A0A2A3ETM1_APICC|nr:Odorant receptor 83b [Apis cerana cerana]
MIVLTFTGTFVKNINIYCILSTMEIGIRFFTFCAYTVAQLTHLFFLTIMGQFLINANEEIFRTIYEAHWYNGSSRTQSLYVLVLRKCLTFPKLTGGGLITLNLDSFVQLVGVWPYQQRFIKFCIRFITSAIVVLTLSAQISRVIKFYSLDVLSDQLPYLDVGFVLLFKQYNYILNEDKLRELLNEIISDRLIKRSKEELEILEIYLKRARVLSTVYEENISIFFCGFMFLLIPSIPPILNIISPLNESRGRELIYPSYYFVDEEKYYYPILMHMIAVALILTSVYVACDTYLVYIVHHGCALLAISGYRAERLRFDLRILTVINENERRYRFKHAVDDIKLRGGDYIDPLTDETYTKVRQSIKAHKTAVEYEAHWYNGSSRTQSLYILVLRKCLSPPKLTGGGLVALNLDSFLQVAYLVLNPTMDKAATNLPYSIASFGTFIKMGNYFLDETKNRLRSD